MPVVNGTQARIEISEKQFEVIVRILSSKTIRTTRFFLEETNLEGSIVLQTPRGKTIIAQDGEVMDLGKGA